MGIEISFIIPGAKSLKDKRSVVKSIISKMKARYNISISEVDANDIINQGVIGIGTVGNNRTLCHQVLDSVVRDIEDLYDIEIHSIEKIE